MYITLTFQCYCNLSQNLVKVNQMLPNLKRQRMANTAKWSLIDNVQE